MLGLWLIHLIVSNISWINTAIAKTICEIIHAGILLYKAPNSDEISLKISFIFMMGLIHIIYLALAFVSDIQKK